MNYLLVVQVFVRTPWWVRFAWKSTGRASNCGNEVHRVVASALFPSMHGMAVAAMVPTDGGMRLSCSHFVRHKRFAFSEGEAHEGWSAGPRRYGCSVRMMNAVR